MLYISTENIKYSTVGASFKVTYSVAPDEIPLLMILHDKLAENNGKGYQLTAKEAEPQTENLFTDKYGDVWEWRGDAWYCISGDEPQTETEIAKAIVHKMIDDAVIAEDAYPDLRQKMHDAVDEYEPQTDCAWSKCDD